MSQKPLAVIVSEFSALSLSVVENLLANFCQVLIVADDASFWKSSIKHIQTKEDINIVDFNEISVSKSASYLVFVDNYYKKNEIVSNTSDILRIKEAISLSRDHSLKTFFVFPSSIKTDDQEVFVLANHCLTDDSTTAGIIFTGEVFGPRMDLNRSSNISSLIKGVHGNEDIYLSHESNSLVLTYIPDFARVLVRGLLSFSTIGQRILYLTEKIEVKGIVNSFSKYRLKGKIRYRKLTPFTQPPTSKHLKMKTNLSKGVAQTIQWFNSFGFVYESRQKAKETNKPEVAIKSVKSFIAKSIKIKKPSIPKLSINSNKTLLAASILFLLLVFPYLLLLSSSGALFFAVKQISGVEVSKVERLATLSSNLAKGSNIVSGVAERAPLIGGLYQGSLKYSQIIIDGTSLINKGISLTSSASNMFVNVVKGENIDISKEAINLSVELGLMYRNLGFLESDLKEIEENPIIEKYLPLSIFSEARNKLKLSQDFINNLPSLLGEDASKTYLILFQNNMELRPTGGFIGSFALATFDNGRLIDINVSDVYSADGQLKGHVEPPMPISKYLGEANWYLRDSNWAANFVNSAQKAEWFLDKEIDQAVDGVIGVDLEFAKIILKEIGPIYLTDYGQKIDHENFYEITQFESEKEFFPGSRKKASFLTALSRELLNQLVRVNENLGLTMFQAFYESLESRHIQVFLHDNASQSVVNEFGWDGGVSLKVCEGNCEVDYLGLVEANLGVNKVNYHIDRNMQLDVYLNGGVIKRRLTANYVNKANRQLGESGKYSNYLRLMMPLEAELESVGLVQGENAKELEFDVVELQGKKEVGVYFEVLPESSKTVVFVWSQNNQLDYSSDGNYNLYWRKQAGTVSDPITVNIIIPQGLNVTGFPDTSLTNENMVSYNTTLTRDFSSRLFW